VAFDGRAYVYEPTPECLMLAEAVEAALALALPLALAASPARIEVQAVLASPDDATAPLDCINSARHAAYTGVRALMYKLPAELPRVMSVHSAVARTIDAPARAPCIPVPGRRPAGKLITHAAGPGVIAEVHEHLERLRDLFYGLAELRDRLKEAGAAWPRPLPDAIVSTVRVKTGLPAMLRRGTIMDVTNAEQAQIAEEAGAVGVMVLDKLPYDVRKAGGVARMADVKAIEEVMASVTIPVSAKVRIGHYYEAVILQQIGVDLIDESEVLTPVDEQHHINKWMFAVPFVNGCRELCEALRRISEGASMIRSKGEAGTGNVAEAVKHFKALYGAIGELSAALRAGDEERLRDYARKCQVPLELATLTARLGRLPVVTFAAGGIATPADAALMMWLGADGVFVGSGIFKSQDPRERAEAIVLAAAHWDDPERVVEAQRMVSERKAMMGIDIRTLKPEELLQIRGV
jgi:pyridoxal 5'-phosphate synthase pdxS subunit